MSIKRVTNPIEFEKLIDDLYALFKDEDVYGGHQLLSHNPDTIKSCYGHSALLTWDVFVWGHETNGSFDAAIIFLNDKSAKFGIAIFSEFLWLSRNPKVGYKLFRTALAFAREKRFKTLCMSTVIKNPKHEKIKAFYNRMGLLKDSETYICKL